MKKPRSKKKIIISVLCVLLALAVLTPCVINAVVMLSASKYIISADEAAGRGADCVLVLGAKVNSNGTLSHMLEDRMSTGVDLYQSGAGMHSPLDWLTIDAAVYCGIIKPLFSPGFATRNLGSSRAPEISL